MIKIGILGDIGSGKSYVAKNFGYPVFNADSEVSKLYKKDRKIFNKLKKVLPKHIYSFPVNKYEISKAILAKPTTAKASFNSHKSTCSVSHPAFFRANGTALAGAVVNHSG